MKEVFLAEYEKNVPIYLNYNISLFLISVNYKNLNNFIQNVVLSQFDIMYFYFQITLNNLF